MAEKLRLRHKDLKRPDQFITKSGEAIVWGRQHRQLLIGVAAAGVAAIVLIGIMAAYRGAQGRDANADLARALSTLGAGQYAIASTQLKEVSVRWSDTPVGPLARLLGANAALRAGDADGAVSELVALEPGVAQLPAYLRQQMLLAWGGALEAKQQWLEAAAKYQAAAALSGPYTGEAIVSEARTRARGGEAERARELYRQAYDQFPDLPDRELVGSKAKL